MPGIASLGNHTSSNRDSWWHLEQDSDGSLWIRYENEDDHGDDWRRPLHDILAKGPSSAKTRFENWVGEKIAGNAP